MGRNFFTSILLILFSYNIFPQFLNISGNISTGNLPVKNALITFTNVLDSLQEYSTISDSSGNYNIIITGINDEENPTNVNSFKLEQNYPNPFTEKTTIKYELKEQSSVQLIIYDILGKEVNRFTYSEKYAGSHNIIWDGRNSLNQRVTPGIYFYQLFNGKEKITKKMLYGFYNNQAVIHYKFPSTIGLLKKGNGEQELLYNVKIKNMYNTVPQVTDTLFTNVLIKDNTVLNFVVKKVEKLKTYNIDGYIKTKSDTPVKYAEIIFKEVTDTNKIFSTLTDSTGYYKLSFINKVDSILFKVQINAADSTQPRIYKIEYEDLVIHSDTTIDFAINEVEIISIVLQGKISTVTSTVKYAQIQFVNDNDTTRIFSTMTDTTGNYHIEITSYIDEMLFAAIILNKESTFPKIYDEVFENIKLQRDTVINFTVETVGQWVKVKRGLNHLLLNIFFLDSLNGWIVGGKGLILHSIDGGDSWGNQFSPIDTSLYTVQFVDSMNGWICAPNAIMKTTDAGNNWEIKYIAKDREGLRTIKFLNKDVGFGVGFAQGNMGPTGAVFRTKDGGETWQTTIFDSIYSPFSISIINENNIWVGAGEGKMIITTDKGETWNIKIAKPQTIAWFTTLQFVDQLNGWAGSHYDPYFLRSTDGGNTWNEYKVYFLCTALGGVETFCFADPFNGWLAPLAGWGTCALLSTTDGGITWKFLPKDMNILSVKSISFFNKNLGWAVGFEWKNSKSSAVILKYKN